MVIHAESDKKKKVTSCAVVNGVICKKCASFEQTQYGGRGYCHFWCKTIFDENGYCNLFKDEENLNGD